MPFTNYLDSAITKLLFGDTAFSPPATYHVGLSTTTPAADGTGVTEPSGGAYARVAVANDATHWHDAPSQPPPGHRISNALAIAFAQASADWGTLTYAVLYDAASGGNLVGYGVLPAPGKTVGNGDTASFAVDQLTITLV